MYQYPTFHVAGVPMDDPSGRWNLLPGTKVLPSFPGRQLYKVPTPGVPGYRSTIYAPGESALTTIVVRFHAMDQYGRIPGDVHHRAAALSANIDLFFMTTALARQGYSGLVEIRRFLGPQIQRVAMARVIASAEPEWSPDRDYADLTLVYEIPSGVWMHPNAEVTKFNVTTGQRHRIRLPGGSAPSLDAMIAVKGPYNGDINSGRTWVGNDHNVGFVIGFKGSGCRVAADEWLVIDALNWKCGKHKVDPKDPDKINWDVSKPYAWLDSSGRPQGSAMTLIPSATLNASVLRVQTQVNTRMQVRARRAWY